MLQACLETFKKVASEFEKKCHNNFARHGIGIIRSGIDNIVLAKK